MACHKSKEAPTNTAAPYTLNPRAFRIAFLYQRLFDQIRRGFFIVGYKVPDEIQFDGYVFHTLYNEMSKAHSKERLTETKKVSSAMTHYELCSFIKNDSDSESESAEELPEDDTDDDDN